MKKMQMIAIAGLMLGVLFDPKSLAAEVTVQTSVENQVTVVRHGAATVEAVEPREVKADPVAVSTQGGVEVRRRERVVAPRVKASPTSTTSAAREAEILRAKLRLLAELADQGLVDIRPIRQQVGPIWKYHPKVYHGVHDKPDTKHHRRPGWQYDDVRGWRYREEPVWSDRPGAVYELLKQLPTRGDGWFVAGWK